MHMKKATNITLATLAAALLASSCIKEADPYEIATEDQVTLETLIEGIPASLVPVSYTHLTLPTTPYV